MSLTSPTGYMVWAVMSTLLGTFLIFHLWSFDRFKCLKWSSNSPTSGAFKRVMTYTYLLSVPLIMAFSIGFATMKYEEGYVDLPGYGIMPKPYQKWRPSFKAAIFPFQLLFAIAWSLEMVTHLEELCFWLFLVNAGQAQQDWFHSHYFRVWTVGSVCAVLYMPLLTIFTRNDPLTAEPYIFLGGALGSLTLTIFFLPILWTFPRFLGNLKNEGVDIQTLVRLTKFHELNTIRVVFRLLFTVPLVILGADGFSSHHPVNESPLATDLLVVIAAVGCIVSSGITLTIFFPRSIEGEIATKNASRDRAQRSRIGTFQSDPGAHMRSFGSFDADGQNGQYYDPLRPSSRGGLLSQPQPQHRQSVVIVGSPALDDDKFDEDEDDKRSITKSASAFAASPTTTAPPTYRAGRELPLVPNRFGMDPERGAGGWDAKPVSSATAVAAAAVPSPVYTPNRRRTEAEGGGVELGAVALLTEDALRAHEQRMSHAHHLLHNYRSPIDVAYASARPRYGPRARGV